MLKASNFFPMILVVLSGAFASLNSFAHASKVPPNQVDYKISAELTPSNDQIHGQEVVQIRNNTGTTLARLYFHVYPNTFSWERDSTYMKESSGYESPDTHFLEKGKGSWLKVNSMSSVSGKVEFKIDHELMTVELSEPLQPGKEIDLNIDFTTQMAPIAERSGVWDGNYSVAQWFPKLMVYDDEGWALQHNARYHFAGEFYGDFGSYDVDLIVPSEIKVGATGHRVSEEIESGNRKKFHYHADQVHDFAWVADAKFIEDTLQVGSTTIHVLSRNEASRVMGQYAKSAIEYFSKKIGPYPYSDFTVGETIYNGPMEYPELIMVRTYPQALSRTFERDMMRLFEMGVVHETSHQWFFGSVGNNEVLNAWLDEGFATFLEQSYMHDTYGKAENIVKFPAILKINDAQLGEALWRIQVTDTKAPIQTPSYEFSTIDRYYTTVYYKTAFFFRHFQALVGKEKLDLMLHEYWIRNLYTNAVPEDWYTIVREFAGAEAEHWWRVWITTNARSDYALKDLESEKLADGKFRHRFTVSQEGSFFAPVEVEFKDEKGEKTRLLANISETQHQVLFEVETQTPLASIVVDPDHVAPDINRFNNQPGILPKVRVWPFTRSIHDDAITLAPFPYINKRPGIGFEFGAGLGVMHYLDWYGYGLIARESRNGTVTTAGHAESIEPDSKWGWVFDATNDDLTNHQTFLSKRSLGKFAGVDPQFIFEIGPERFGNIGDGLTSAGLDAALLFQSLQNGHPFRYSLIAQDSEQKNIDTSGAFNRASLDAQMIFSLGYMSRLSLRGFRGQTYGKGGRSSRFDLESDVEGGMRFAYFEAGQYKTKNLSSGTFDLSFPMPNAKTLDHLAIFYSPTWEWHLFGDFSNSVGRPKKLFCDFGIGTRIDFATGGFGHPSMDLELVPYQSAIQPTGWGLPLVLFSLTNRLY